MSVTRTLPAAAREHSTRLTMLRACASRGWCRAGPDRLARGRPGWISDGRLGRRTRPRQGQTGARGDPGGRDDRGLRGLAGMADRPQRLPAAAWRDGEQARPLAGTSGSPIAPPGGSMCGRQPAGAAPGVRRLAVAIADELERVEVLTAQDLERLIATTQETWSTGSEVVSPIPPPDGFEGRGAVGELVHLDDQPVAERVAGIRSAGRCSARLTRRHQGTDQPEQREEIPMMNMTQWPFRRERMPRVTRRTRYSRIPKPNPVRCQRLVAA